MKQGPGGTIIWPIFLFTFLFSLAKMFPSPAATYVFLKFGYSEKATKIWPIFHLEFDATNVK